VNARSGCFLASSAIHCRFVDRFVGSSVPSRVSRQWFLVRGGSLPSGGSRRARFPAIGGTMKTARKLLTILNAIIRDQKPWQPA
jgi:hypothetical protein